MLNYRMRFVSFVAILALLGSPPVSAETTKTWHLREGPDWRALSAESEHDKYLLAVAEIKKLIDEGRCKAAQKEFDRLKKDFPEIEDSVLSAFVNGEILRCKGKLVKAVWSYNKFLNAWNSDSELYAHALERQYRIAEQFLAGRKKTVLGVFKIKGHAQGIRIMEGISWRDGLDEPNGIVLRAAETVAKSYEERGEFDLAHLKWLQIFETYDDILGTYSRPRRTTLPPLIAKVHKEALLSMAQAKYNAYKGPEYDTSDLIGQDLSGKGRYDSAKGCYIEFKARYPEDAEEIGVDQILKQINKRLARKQLTIAQHYQKTHDYQKTRDKRQDSEEDKEINPANLYYQMVIQNWPASEAAETAKTELIKNLPRKERKK